MKIAILSDVHGNFEALHAVLTVLKERSITKIINLGDTIGYGPDPIRCLEYFMYIAGKEVSLSEEDKEFLAPFSTDVLMGNHDSACVGFSDMSYFNEHALQAIIWTRKQLTDSHEMYIKNLPMSYKWDSYYFYHSTPEDAEKWYYLDSVPMAREYFKKSEREVVFVGHTHKLYLFIYNNANGKVSGAYPQKSVWNIDPNYRYIVNPGSVGQPRDGNYMASFMILDTVTKELTVERADYDVKTTQAKMMQARLPYVLAERLALGV